MHMRALSVAAITMMLSALCQACTQSQAATAAAASTACPAIEIAEVVAPDSQGARQFNSEDGALIYVSAESLVTTADIAHARPAMAEGHEVLEIDLDASSAGELREFSASHVGARVAFVVDHSVRRVARILDPLTGQGLMIDPVSTSEAAELMRCVGAS